jgi:hypothetical protein
VGIYFINDLLKDDGSFFTLQEFKNKYRLNSHFLEYNGLIYAIPQKWKNEIVGIQKLESITDKSVTLLSYCVKPCKPVYKLFSEKYLNIQIARKMATQIREDNVKMTGQLCTQLHFSIKLI